MIEFKHYIQFRTRVLSDVYIFLIYEKCVFEDAYLGVYLFAEFF